MRVFIGTKSIVLIACLWLPGVALSAWSGKHRGFAVVPTNQTSLCTENFFQSVRNMKATGLDLVSLRVAWSQQTLTDSILHRYARTPTDDALACGIDYILSQGMKFGIHVAVNVPGWRANIDPDDRDRWFRAMGDVAIKYARDFAAPYGATHFSVGTEMYSVVSNVFNSENAAAPGRYRWPEIVADVRSFYSGTIMYSAQHSGNRSAIFEDNDLMSNIDVLGFSGYWPLNASDLEGLLNEWGRVERQSITPAINRYGKQVVLAEIGYRPCDFAFERPFDSQTPCTYNGGAQALAWDAVLAYFADKPYLDGLIGGWAWSDDPGVGGEGDTDYTPWRKPAADVIAGYWFTGSEPTPEPTPEPPPSVPAPTFPFGESQFSGVPYCDAADSNVPDHGWGNLSNYVINGATPDSTGCIFSGGASDNPYGDPARGYQPNGGVVNPPPANSEYPFGESQLSGVPYCDQADANVPDHGWGNLVNYSSNGQILANAGCIHQSSAADNPYGDPSRGYQPAGGVVNPPIAGVFPFGESQVAGTPYCDSDDSNVPDHGWGNMANHAVNGTTLASRGCIYRGGNSDNPIGDPGVGFQPG